MTCLHNMSSVPQTVIAHIVGPQFTTTAGVLVCLGKDLRGVSAGAILTQLGIAGPLPPKAARARLCELINERSLTLPYPTAALVSDQATGSERTETDLLTICTVLAKSSNRIYMRDKEPNLGAILRSRRVILQIPNNWRPQ